MIRINILCIEWNFVFGMAERIIQDNIKIRFPSSEHVNNNIIWKHFWTFLNPKSPKKSWKNLLLWFFAITICVSTFWLDWWLIWWHFFIFYFKFTLLNQQLVAMFVFRAFYFFSVMGSISSMSSSSNFYWWLLFFSNCYIVLFRRLIKVIKSCNRLMIRDGGTRVHSCSSHQWYH